MKGILKALLGLVIGISVGLAIAGTIAVVFTDATWSSFFNKILSAKTVTTLAWVLLWTIVCAVLQIIIHEAGHLVAGLMTGYRFVSFRVFSLTLIRQDGHLQLRRYSLSGTGGQCLMAPPDRPADMIDTRLYNLGGVLANLIVAAIAIVLLVFRIRVMPEWLGTFLLMLALIGIFFALTNGIPMKAGGIGNDGYNLLHLEKSPENKQCVINILNAHALLQQGHRPKDIPDTMFYASGPVDWSDGLQANWQLYSITKMIDQHQWENAYAQLSDALMQKDKIMQLFMFELEMEMIFVCLVTSRYDEARQYISPEVQQFIDHYAPTQSSKQRVQFAITLLLDGDRNCAVRLLNNLEVNRKNFVIQGEVDMDIDLMRWLLENRC